MNGIGLHENIGGVVDEGNIVYVAYIGNADRRQVFIQDIVFFFDIGLLCVFVPIVPDILDRTFCFSDGRDLVVRERKDESNR